MIQNNTIVNNSALQGGGGVATMIETHVTLVGNILAGNTEGFGSPTLSSQCSDYGVSFSSSYNTVGPEADVACAFNGAGDQRNAVILLSPLAAHGGPTATLQPLVGSAGIMTEERSNCPATDARGVVRPQVAFAPCDTGAVELPVTAPASLCTALTGKITTTLTFSGCTPGAGYTSATAAATSFAGGRMTLLWHSSLTSSVASFEVSQSSPGGCAAGSTENLVAGAIIQSTTASVKPLSKVSFRACITAAGNVSLVHSTKASL